mgnify:CR=1 FL=1
MTVLSAPLATWQANTRVEHVTLVSPHTLLVSADQKATLLMLPSMTVVQEMSYDGVLAGMAGTQGQYLIATSVDGHWLAVALLSSRETAPGERDSFVDIWSMTEQRRLARIPVPLTQTKAYFYALTMSRDGQRIGWITQGRGTYRSTVTVWDRHTQTITFTRTIEDATRGFGLTVYLLGLEPFEFIGIFKRRIPRRRKHADGLIVNPAGRGAVRPQRPVSRPPAGRHAGRGLHRPGRHRRERGRGRGDHLGPGVRRLGAAGAGSLHRARPARYAIAA